MVPIKNQNKMSGFWMVWTIWIPEVKTSGFKFFGYSNVRFSDPHCIGQVSQVLRINPFFGCPDLNCNKFTFGGVESSKTESSSSSSAWNDDWAAPDDVALVPRPEERISAFPVLIERMWKQEDFDESGCLEGGAGRVPE